MSPTVDESLLALLGLFGLLAGVVGYLWTGLALSAMFRKMGEDPWKGWVPVFNLATVLAWGGFSPWLVLVGFIPIVGQVALLILLIVSAHRINPGFGYGAGMTVLAAFFFVVWASILGFGPARWLGARAAAWRPTPTAPAERPVEKVASTPAPAPAPAAPRVELSDDAFAPPPPQTGPVWVPPDITTAPPAAAASPVSSPPAAAAGASAPPPASAVPVEEAGAADPVQSAAEDPEEISWPSEIDDVSAVSPSPFPPSSAAGRRYAAPPVRDEVDDASGPVAFVPGRRATSVPAPVDPAPAEPAVTRMPAVPGGRRSVRTDDVDEPDGFPELSGEVSAVIGSPVAGTPRSARSSVSAQQRRQEPFGADEDDDLERTVIARRLKRPVWELVPASGAPLPLTSDVVILGRRPAADPTFPRAQLLAVPDTARTVSKTHARIELRGERWLITDLASTNGVLLRTLMGEELEIEPGTELQAGERFYLGDEEFLLHRAES